MFQKACSIYEKCLVQVGGVTPGVVTDAKAKYSFVVVAKYDGLFKAEGVASSVKCDVAVLQETEQLECSTLDNPVAWPVLQENFNFQRGMSLGYMTYLHKTDRAY